MRHSRRCASRSGGPCSCKPTYQAQVWSARDRKPLRRTFRTVSEATAWRQVAAVDLRRRRITAPSDLRLTDAADAWLAAATSGVIRTRSGEKYKPSAIRSYDAALRRYITPELGGLRLSAVTRQRIQDLIDGLVSRGLAPSTVANAVLPLRAIFRWAVDREELVANPTLKVSLPRDRRRRDRIAEPQDIEPLLAALPDGHRALWATALYTGLRRGELQALDWSTVDLERCLLQVENSWDRVVGLVTPKSRSGERTVPIPKTLRAELSAHRLRRGTGGKGFVFSADGENPMNASKAARLAKRAWAAAGLQPISFHECRHSYAAYMIAAGVNAKALSIYMGHSSITVTLDRYGHLLPGSEREAARLLDRFLINSARPLGAQRSPAPPSPA